MLGMFQIFNVYPLRMLSSNFEFMSSTLATKNMDFLSFRHYSSRRRTDPVWRFGAFPNLHLDECASGSHLMERTLRRIRIKKEIAFCLLKQIKVSICELQKSICFRYPSFKVCWPLGRGHCLDRKLKPFLEKIPILLRNWADRKWLNEKFQTVSRATCLWSSNIRNTQYFDLLFWIWFVRENSVSRSSFHHFSHFIPATEVVQWSIK